MRFIGLIISGMVIFLCYLFDIEISILLAWFMGAWGVLSIPHPKEKESIKLEDHLIEKS